MEGQAQTFLTINRQNLVWDNGVVALEYDILSVFERSSIDHVLSQPANIQHPALHLATQRIKYPPDTIWLLRSSLR